MVLTAAETAQLVNAGELSAEASVRAALLRAEALDPLLNAFRFLDPAGAIRQARSVDARRRAGEELPLAGVPVPLKATQPVDGVLARRLRDNGAVVIGTTATPPPGYHQTWGVTPRGRTRNPWDLSRSPGGSSAGAAAAVAAGIVPLATGGDSAGSLRIPAAWCGVVGHKPTAGLLPRRDPGRFRLTSSGALTRTVGDQALFLDAMTPPAGRPRLEAALGVLPARPLRAAWSEDLGHVEVAEEVAALARAGADELAQAGAISWTGAKVDLLSLRDVWGPLRKAEKLALGGEPVPEGLVTAAMLEVRAENLRRLDRLFEQVDVLLLPTTPVDAHLVEVDPPGHECELTWMFNLAGLPATSMPAAWDAPTLPVGLQVVARPGADATCLVLGGVLERLHGPAPVAPSPAVLASAPEHGTDPGPKGE